MTATSDPASICREIARLHRETLEEWTERNAREAEERAKKIRAHKPKEKPAHMRIVERRGGCC